MKQQREIENVVAFNRKDEVLTERPRVRFKRAFFSFFILVFVLGVIYLTTPLSRLGVVEFEGINVLTRSELITLMNIDENQLFLTIRPGLISANIGEHPAIREVQTQRLWLNRLRITLVEHEVGACAMIDGSLYHVLSDGQILDVDAGLRANCEGMTIQNLTAQTVEAGVVSLFVRQFVRVDPEIRSLIQLIEHAPRHLDEYRFSLSMIDGNIVNITTHTMVESLENYLIFVESLTTVGSHDGRNGTFHFDVGTYFSPFVLDEENPPQTTAEEGTTAVYE
jgi:cell division septal protein FtsQ